MKVLETRWILGKGCICVSADQMHMHSHKSRLRVEKEIIREDRGTLGMSVLHRPGGREDLCLICVPTKNCPVMRWGLQIAKSHRPRPDPPECKGK